MMGLKRILVSVFAAALLVCGWLFAQSERTRAAEAEGLRPKVETLSRALELLPPSDSKGNEAARRQLEDLEREVRSLDASWNQRGVAALLRDVEIREAGAARSSPTLSPKIRDLLEPAPRGTSPEEIQMRRIRREVLLTALEAGVEDIDFIQTGRPSDGRRFLTIALPPVRLRFRAPQERIARLVASLSQGAASGRAYQVERLRLQQLPNGNRPEILADLELSALVPLSR